ncbi:hypothetical protein [Candidatus Vampirococcus lugosii]|uniref:Uncharacterized protein n=1 Tax=Candidatus Vampirococcus lugosii TaxID=2789015 RepID=A0ABS5QKJ9_9BACT|nr:hypothetical protein [Candidatus Vampirococcus lugosii]MBS8121751.1 hypothetical protein [Candidatus Vampirococcus lugosii]
MNKNEKNVLKNSKFNSRFIRYTVFFLTLFMSIGAIRSYIQYYNTILSINETINESQEYYLETSFMTNFELPYLESDLARKLIAHESGIPEQNEKIIRFENQIKKNIDNDIKKEEIQEIEQKEEIIKIISPKDSWNHFLNGKINNIDFLEKISKLNLN